MGRRMICIVFGYCKVKSELWMGPCSPINESGDLSFTVVVPYSLMISVTACMAGWIVQPLCLCIIGSARSCIIVDVSLC